MRRDTIIVVGLLALVGVLLVVKGAFTAETMLRIAVVIPAIILHELAHGVVALALGDDTAQRAGRLTLNPIKHIDPFGTIILPTLLALTSLGMIGYAKPVPVNPSRLRHPKNDSLLVSLAGPATNLALALASLLWLRLVVHPDFFQVEASWPMAQQAVFLFGLLNVVLAVFNLLPIPPLDGSAMVERVLPKQWMPGWHKFRQYALPVLIILVLLRPTALSGLFGAATRVWLRALGS